MAIGKQVNEQLAPVGTGSENSSPTGQPAPGNRFGNSKRIKLNAKERSEIDAKKAEGKDAEQISRELGIPLPAVQRHLSRKSSVATSNTGLAGATPKSDGGLDAALKAAGFSGASPDAKPGAANGAGAPLPTPTPAQLIAALEMVNTTCCRIAATVWRVPLDKKEFSEIAALTKEEKDALEFLAPYAAEYAPAVMQHIKPVLAGAFVAGYLTFSGLRVYQIYKLAPKTIEKDRLKALARAKKKPEAQMATLEIEEPEIQ